MYITQNRISFLATWFSLESRLGLTQLSSWDSRFALLGDTELLFLSLQTLQTCQEAFSHAEQTSCDNTLFPSILPIGNSSQKPPAIGFAAMSSLCGSSSGGAQCETYLSLVCSCRRVCACMSCLPSPRGEAQENDTEQAPSVVVKDITLALQSFRDSTALHPSKWNCGKGPLCSGNCLSPKRNPTPVISETLNFYHPLASKRRAYILIQTNEA